MTDSYYAYEESQKRIGQDPKCMMSEDGKHFWWEHDCVWFGTDEKYRSFSLLPIGPDYWTVVSKDPLTVAPSLMCTGCKTHGFFHEGVWLPV